MAIRFLLRRASLDVPGLTVIRTLCSEASILPSAASPDSLSVAPAERHAYQTHDFPVYSLPLYGADPCKIEALSDPDVNRILKAYGGLLRDDDVAEDRRSRLLKITRDRLTIRGVVVSDRMDKSVVVASRRRAFARKLRAEYEKTRRFMAHDEQNLCREGDRVEIRSCRPLSRHKHHVVVRNYGEKARIGNDNRATTLKEIIASSNPE